MTERRDIMNKKHFTTKDTDSREVLSALRHIRVYFK